MNTNIQTSQSSPLNLLTTSDYPTKSQKALAIPADHQDTPMRLPKDEAKYLIHHEQACSPSSTVYPEEGTDISDSVSALAVSRQSSACTTKKNKSAVNSTQNPFSTVLGSGMVEEDNLHENETVKGEEKAFSDIPSRKSTADESALDEEEEDRSVEEDDSEEIKDWNEKKEKLLRSLAGKCKYDWKKIAKKFNTTEKTDIAPSVLKQKYKGLVNAAIPLRVKFSHQEDLMIAKYFEQYGCDWVQIATHFTDRNAMMLKNRYYSHIRKRNLLDSMLEEVNGGVKREESQIKEEENMAEEELSEESEAQNEENIVVEPINIKVEAPIKVEEVHREKVYCEYEPFYGNREFLYRHIFNNIFDMENALRSELHHTIQMSYH